MRFYADSHVGLVREENEDSYAFSFDRENGIGFAVVADGVGGHDRGEVASRMTVQYFIESWRRELENFISGNISSRDFLLRTVTDVNKKVFDLNRELGNSMPMGTTVVAVLFIHGRAVVGHVGDSRAYLFRNSAVTQLTRDHSYVEELLRNNMISEEEARVHPLGHIITRSVGPVDSLEMDISEFDLVPGDRFLLCSDGLTNHMTDEELQREIISALEPRDAVKKLLLGSLRRGGDDNVTVLSCFF